MKKILWFLSVILVMVIATGVSADTRSDKCNTYSNNDLGISSANAYLLAGAYNIFGDPEPSPPKPGERTNTYGGG